MLKIFDNYYLDASSVCYMLKKAHVKGDGMEECDVCTYHTRLEEALAEAVRRGLREGVASGELTEWEQLCGELRRLKHEVQGLLESISPADDALDLTLKNGNNCAWNPLEIAQSLGRKRSLDADDTCTVYFRDYSLDWYWGTNSGLKKFRSMLLNKYLPAQAYMAGEEEFDKYLHEQQFKGLELEWHRPEEAEGENVK